jgi:hypothetical protein
MTGTGTGWVLSARGCAASAWATGLGRAEIGRSVHSGRAGGSARLVVDARAGGLVSPDDGSPQLAVARRSGTARSRRGDFSRVCFTIVDRNHRAPTRPPLVGLPVPRSGDIRGLRMRSPRLRAFWAAIAAGSSNTTITPYKGEADVSIARSGLRKPAGSGSSWHPPGSAPSWRHVRCHGPGLKDDLSGSGGRFPSVSPTTGCPHGASHLARRTRPSS